MPSFSWLTATTWTPFKLLLSMPKGFKRVFEDNLVLAKMELFNVVLHEAISDTA